MFSTEFDGAKIPMFWYDDKKTPMAKAEDLTELHIWTEDGVRIVLICEKMRTILSMEERLKELLKIENIHDYRWIGNDEEMDFEHTMRKYLWDDEKEIKLNVVKHDFSKIPKSLKDLGLIIDYQYSGPMSYVKVKYGNDTAYFMLRDNMFVEEYEDQFRERFHFGCFGIYDFTDCDGKQFKPQFKLIGAIKKEGMFRKIKIINKVPFMDKCEELNKAVKELLHD